MSTITNLSNEHVGNTKAECSDRNLWILGYDLGVEVDGPALARSEKIIRGLRDLTMVVEDTLRAHEHPVAKVKQLEDVKVKITFMLNHPSKTLALEVEEAMLAMRDGLLVTMRSNRHGHGTALTNDGWLAEAAPRVKYGGNLITTSRPQWGNRNGSPAVGLTREAPCTLETYQKTHGVASATRLRGGGPKEKRPLAEMEGTWGEGAHVPEGRGQQGSAPLSEWGRQKKWREEDTPQSPQELAAAAAAAAAGRMLTSTNDLLHHVRQWVDQATWGVVDNSWRGGLLDDKGKIRYGWGNAADTFGEDPRWIDYITEVRCGDNPSLTWEQYLAALITRDGITFYPNGHKEQQWRLWKQSLEPRSQAPTRPQPQAKAIASTELPYGHTSKKALKMQEYKRQVALTLEKKAAGNKAREEEQLQKRKVEENNRRAIASRWKDDHGEAVAAVPLLPPDLWAHITQQGQDEHAQHKAWVTWADATLLQLVVVWFRTGGQRDSHWLGKLVSKNGGVCYTDTDNIGKRFAPWCRAMLQLGKPNAPLHYSGNSGAPANFVKVHQHMLSMMIYMGFPNVIERLQRILRLLAQSLVKGSSLPKYIPGPPDNEDDEDDWEDEAPEAGPQPPLPQKLFVASAGRR
jgi:hypothetical protein